MLIVNGCDYCNRRGLVTNFKGVITNYICRACVEELLAVFKHPNQHTKKELA